MKTIRRNLPINDNYFLIDSFYTGGIDNGLICENCGKIIANVAVIKNDKHEQFNVGMDCAATLTKLTGLSAAEANFTEAKAIRAKVNKATKEGKEISIANVPSGLIRISANNFSITSVTPAFCGSYLPDFYNKISNKDKNGFTPIPTEDVAFNTLSSINEARTLYSFAKKFEYKEFTIVIGLTEGKTMDGKFNGSYLFAIYLYVGEKYISTNTTYMPKDINPYIAYAINKYLFDNYTK